MRFRTPHIALLIIMISMAIDLRGAAGAPTIGLKQIDDKPRRAFERVELVVSLDHAYSNPFDPDEIAVDATITSPVGKSYSLPAFWDGVSSDRGLEAKATGAFHVRFCPTSAGRWSVSVSARDRDGTAKSDSLIVDVQAASNRGFVRCATDDPRYLQFDSGQPYFPVGLNLAWAHGEADAQKYLPWFKSLSDAGGNFARVWMCHGPVMLEGPDIPLGRYRLSSARYFDALLELAEQHGIYLMLTFVNHRELLEKDMWGPAVWPANPYNATNGGPATQPVNFFTDEAARKLFTRRLRYLIARYAAFTSLACWELFNEQELAGVEVPNVWNSEMAGYIRRNDPYEHLISTSATVPAPVWKLDEMSITQSHIYGDGEAIDLITPIAFAVSRHERFNKPHLIAEFGISYKGPDAPLDPNGTATTLHNSLWAATFSGAAGAAAYWWWDNYIAPKNLWHEFAGIAKFSQTIDWPRRHFKSISLPPPQFNSAEPETFSDLALHSAWGWAKADEQPILVYPNGQASGALPTFYFGPDKAEMRTKTTLIVELQQAGDMTLHFKKVSDHSTLRVIVDDHPAADFQFSALPGSPDQESTEERPGKKPVYQAVLNKDRKVPLSAGKHTIVLENLGGDWIAIDRVTFPGALSSRSADLCTLALQDSSAGQTLVWLFDARSNWQSDKENLPPRKLDNISLTIPVSQSGELQATWWDTRAGTIIRKDSAAPSDGRLMLRSPPFARDIAVEISRVKR